jgi:hypothetical protein
VKRGIIVIGVEVSTILKRFAVLLGLWRNSRRNRCLGYFVFPRRSENIEGAAIIKMISCESRGRGG